MQRDENSSEQSQPLVAPASIRSWVADLAQPVAITGGTGFVGSHLVDTLCAAGLQPRVLVREPQAPRWIKGRPFLPVPGSLTDQRALQQLVDGAGTVLHLAGVVRAGRAAELDRGNRIGTANLVAAIRETAPAARLVHVSSLAAAGPSSAPEGVGPEVVPRPISCYGRSKLAAEAEVQSLGDSTWWTILRPPAIYGSRDTDMFELFRMAARGWLAAPAGERWLTIAHVADVVRAIMAAAAGDQPHLCYHLGEPQPYRHTELMQLVAEAGAVRARQVQVPGVLVTATGLCGSFLHQLGFKRITITRDKAREILARHWTARTTDSLAALGLGEQIRFIDGARQTWAWYRRQGWIR
jgi:nucleoside-diphosphate-sugar epimerase